jgi:hypothetical protein
MNFVDCATVFPEKYDQCSRTSPFSLLLKSSSLQKNSRNSETQNYKVLGGPLLEM